MTPEEQAAADAAAAKAVADAEAARVAAEAKAAADAALPKQFSQADLDAIAGRTRQEATEKAQRDLLASLGVTDVEAAKTALAAAKAAEDAQKTDLQRATEERDKAIADAAALAQITRDTVVASRLDVALRDAGINPARIEAAKRLVDQGALKVEGSEVTGVAEAVASLKAATPEWFGVAGSPPDVTGTGSGGGTADYSHADKKTLGEQLAKYGIKTR